MPLDERASSDSRLDEVPPPMPQYEPQVQPTSSSPSPLSTAPGDDGSTSGADTPAEEQNQQQPEPLPEFDPKYRAEFEGLLFIGALRDEFEWMGHKFVIRTLKTDELAEIALAIKPYSDTVAEEKVYQAGVVSAAVISIDGRPLPLPISSDPADTAFANRFRYVLANWYSPTIDAVYERYYRLELKVRELLESMGNRSG